MSQRALATSATQCCLREHGDDVATQLNMMMSREMWRKYLKPRLKKVIDSAREIKPDIIIDYHSDGNIQDIIGDLVEIGIDILNPVQPECMDPVQDTLVFTSGDNMDSLIYTPGIFNDMCGNSFRQIADVIHENGKLLFTHACGQLKKIIKLCADAGVDGMEGMAPPPLGDIGFGEARDLLGLEFVIQGGITCFEEEFTGADVKSSLYSFVKQLFDELPDKHAFIFGSGCCVSPYARYDNLLLLRDACREFGRGVRA